MKVTTSFDGSTASWSRKDKAYILCLFLEVIRTKASVGFQSCIIMPSLYLSAALSIPGVAFPELQVTL